MAGSDRRPVAVVTGANRGIGLEVCRQLAERDYEVVLGSRDKEVGRRAAAELGVHACQLDVTDDGSVRGAATWCQQQFGRCDALVNNAAILYDTWARASSADLEEVRAGLDTNLLGAWRTTARVPALTRVLAAELRADRVLVNAVCPGWTATDMGGPGGRPVADGAASVVWAMMLPDDGPTGGFFRDGRAVPW